MLETIGTILIVVFGLAVFFGVGVSMFRNWLSAVAFVVVAGGWFLFTHGGPPFRSEIELVGIPLGWLCGYVIYKIQGPRIEWR